jgi:hypothetical protein
MKPCLFTICLLLVLPMLLIGTLNARTNAMMPAEVASGTTTRVSPTSHSPVFVDADSVQTHPLYTLRPIVDTTVSRQSK